MKVSYVTSFYNGTCEGRFGRFHDWAHTLRDMDEPPFEYDIHSMMAINPDGYLATNPTEHLGKADELYGTKRNKIEQILELPRILQGLRDSDPDLIHLISFNPILYPSVAYAFSDKPLVLGPNIGGWYPNRYKEFFLEGPTNKFKHYSKFKLRKKLINKSGPSQLVAFSQYHREMLKHLNINDSQITILQPGVNRIFSAGNKEKNPTPPYELLYVGGLTNQKGYHIMIKALHSIDSDVNVRIVGSGQPDENLSKSQGVPGNISFEGYVSRSKLPQYYRSADLFIGPNLDEMGPNTQIESLACGTPVVATDSKGMNEISPELGVRYFWPREPEVLAKAIDEALNEIETLTELAREHSPEFQATKTVEQLRGIYEGIVT